MRTVSKIQLSLLVLVLTVAIPVVSYAADGKIKIGQTPSTTFPIVISESGSYVLTSNLQVSTNFSCIQITADNVTLDLNGFVLIGPGTGSGGHGIYVSSDNNVSISNGTVRNFLNSGIYFLSTTHKNQLKDLKCTNNGQAGINVRYATIVNCITEDNGTNGISAYYSTIKDCISNNNTDDGFQVLSSTVFNCQAYSNDNRGIYSRRSTITDCTIHGSGYHGIEAFDSTITNCTSYGHTTSGANGIGLTDSTAIHCTANANDWGFIGRNTTLTNCTANMNQHPGFYLYNSVLANCTADSNHSAGIISEHTSVVTNCNASNNYVDGIEVRSTSRIEGNNVRGNGQSENLGYGIRLPGGSGRDNYVIKNTASDNYSGNFYDNGTNNYMPLTGDNRNYGF